MPSEADIKFFQTAESKFDARLKREIAGVRARSQPDKRPGEITVRDWTPVREAFENHGRFLELHPESTQVPMIEKVKKPKATAKKAVKQ